MKLARPFLVSTLPVLVSSLCPITYGYFAVTATIRSSAKLTIVASCGTGKRGIPLFMTFHSKARDSVEPPLWWRALWGPHPFSMKWFSTKFAKYPGTCMSGNTPLIRFQLVELNEFLIPPCLLHPPWCGLSATHIGRSDNPVLLSTMSRSLL